MEQIVTFSLLFLIVIGLSLVVILSPIIFQKTTPTPNLKGSNLSQEHSRPICVDSSVFKADFDGKLRSCAWVSHDPASRCDIKGTDTNGRIVPAKEACYDACDTGNCRRRK